MLNSTANTTDKRRGLRKSAIQEQICVVELAGGRSAMLLDVSELGIGVQCVEGALSQPKTPIRFTLPGSSTIVSGEGQVAWSDQTGCMGIRFTNVAAELKEEIRKWVMTDANPFFEDPAGEEGAVEHDVRDRVAELEARIIVSGWAEVQALNFLVDQIAAMTQAGGVAIAVEDGTGIVCKASSGIAPQAGVRINSRSGLSWECLRTADIVHCVDTETDPRVDRIVCRQLNMRSAILVPVKRDGRVAGLVEVFSSRAHAFNANTVVLLKSVAEAVASLEYDLAPSEPPQMEVPKAAPAPVTAPPPATPTITPVSSSAATAAAVKPAPAPIVAEPRPAAAKPAPLEFPKAVRETPPPQPVAPKPVVVPKPAVAQPPRVTAATAAAKPAVVAAPATAKTAEKAADTATEKSREMSARKPRKVDGEKKVVAVAKPPATAPVPAEIIPVPDIFRPSEPLERPNFSLKVGGGIAAAAVCAALVFGGFYWAHSGTKTSAAAAPSTPPPATQPAPVAVPPVTASSGASIPVGKPVGSGTVNPEPVKPPAATTQKQAVAVEIADSSIPVRVAHARAEQPDVAPVSAAPLPISTQNAAGVSSILTGAVAVPTLSRTRVSEGVTGGRQISRVEPRYPNAAGSLRISGTVVLTAHISKTGKVSSVDVVSGSPILAAAASEAVRQWRYEPFRLNGQPIENTITVQVKFSQPQ